VGSARIVFEGRGEAIKSLRNQQGKFRLAARKGNSLVDKERNRNLDPKMYDGGARQHKASVTYRTVVNYGTEQTRR
jgi:hypothetical protein